MTAAIFIVKFEFSAKFRTQKWNQMRNSYFFPNFEIGYHVDLKICNESFPFRENADHFSVLEYFAMKSMTAAIFIVKFGFSAKFRIQKWNQI